MFEMWCFLVSVPVLPTNWPCGKKQITGKNFKRCIRLPIHLWKAFQTLRKRKLALNVTKQHRGCVLMGGRMKETDRASEEHEKTEAGPWANREKQTRLLSLNNAAFNHHSFVWVCLQSAAKQKKHTHNRLKELRCQPDKTCFHIIHIRLELNLARSLFVDTFIRV